MTPNKRRSAFNAWPGSSCRVLWQDMHFTPTAPLSTLQVSFWGSPEMDCPPIQEGGGGVRNTPSRFKCCGKRDNYKLRGVERPKENYDTSIRILKNSAD